MYFTSLNVGGVDFAILEDRKFKTGPAGKIPKMGPRPDHINDPKYDPNKIDLPGLQLLGPRQEKFLADWSADWTHAEMKGVLSQTAFCGAVHMHGGADRRLLADLDCNGWPQTPSRNALKLIRRAWAVHLCGDQHLAVTVKHGIEEHGDGPYGFTGPALVNTIYGRWWHPLDEPVGLVCCPCLSVLYVLRALARELIPVVGRPGWDYVLIGRAEATATRPYDELRRDLAHALRRLGPDK